MTQALLLIAGAAGGCWGRAPTLWEGAEASERWMSLLEKLPVSLFVAFCWRNPGTLSFELTNS